MTLKKILKKVKKIDLSTNNKINSLFVGNYRSVFLGRGIEFADLRPYELGDDVRDIDWKTTAKQDKIFIKKYHETRNNTLFFILDISPSMFFTSQKESKFEKALETFAVLAFAAVRNGDRVGVIFSGGPQVKIFPPKKGKRNVLKILSTALEQYEKLEKRKNYYHNQNNLASDLLLVQKILKHSAVIFWFSGFIPNFAKNQELSRHIKTLSLKHDFIPVIFTDSEERRLTMRGNIKFQDAFSGKIKEIYVNDNIAQEFQKIYQNKKNIFLLFFRKARMESIFINNSQDIFKELLFFFKKRQRHLI